MDFNNNSTVGFFSGIILMACIYGFLLVYILFFNKDFKSKSNKFLSMSILGVCIILGYEFLGWFELEEQVPSWLLYLPLYIRTSIPVGVFYFAIFLINPEHRLTRYEKLGVALIVVEIILTLCYIPLNLFVEDLYKVEEMEYIIQAMSWVLTIIASIALLPLGIKRVNAYQKYLFDNYSTTNRKSLRWLEIFLVVTLIIALLSMVSFVLYLIGDWENAELIFTYVTLCFMVLLFWIGYFLVLQYRWFEVAPVKNEDREEYNVSNKLSSNTQKYYDELKMLIQDKKVYEDVNLTLDTLANQLQISSGYLSQIIKENEQKNFFEFINTHRVEAVKRKLLDMNYKDYTIMGIALESGFNSKSTFNSVFKKIARETPSAFKKRSSSLN